MSQPVTDLLGDAIPKTYQWFPTDREASNFMDLYCSVCAKLSTDDDLCPVWEDVDPVEWIGTPDGTKCTEFKRLEETT